MTRYYFAIASQHFLMDEEPIEEILRERTNHYKSINKNIDFWLITNPNFINANELIKIKDKIPNTPTAIISLDKEFIQWLKLRVGFVATGKFELKSNLIN